MFTSPDQVFDAKNPAVLLEWKIPKWTDYSVKTSTEPTKIIPPSENPGILDMIGRAILSFLELFSGQSTQDRETLTKDTLREDPLIPELEPLSGNATSYDISAQLHVYERLVATASTKLNTFQPTVSSSISEPVDVKQIMDEDGNVVANAALLYSSFNGDTKFHYKVVSPGGVCLIGQSEDCHVKSSTYDNNGNMQSVLMDNQMYRIKYSGSENSLERFTITSIDPIVGNWDITLETIDGVSLSSAILENIEVKIKYKSHQEKLVTITSEE